MANVLVTGGTGLIGAAVAEELVARGDDVTLFGGDIRDRAAVGKAVKGVTRVFHAAGLRSLRAADRRLCFEVNVQGTKIVLEECLRAGVERVVYTSSAAAVGPAEPTKSADETQLFTAARLGIAYVNSKHEAEADAMRLAARGLPLVCVNPTFVLGPGAGPSTGLVRRFLTRSIPFYAPGGLNIVDVRDVARGHVLADERGKVGERYLLAGRNYTWDRLFADLSRIAAVAPPPLRLPFALPGGSDELRAAREWWTYRATKAGRELRWKARPHEETLEATVQWWLDNDGDRIAAAREERGVRERARDAALGGAGLGLRLAARARRMVPA